MPSLHKPTLFRLIERKGSEKKIRLLNNVSYVILAVNVQMNQEKKMSNLKRYMSPLSLSSGLSSRMKFK